MVFFVFLSCIPIMVSVSSKKLNGDQAFESMSLLGGLEYFSFEETHFIIVIITNK